MLDRVELKKEQRVVEAQLEKKGPTRCLVEGIREKVHSRSHPAIRSMNGTSQMHFLAVAR
jgi:hypothetical protein